MSNSFHEEGTSSTSLWYSLFRHPLPMERECAIFITVSAFDVFMTYILLCHGYVESNPVALMFFNGWNIAGLAYFKFSLVALVAVIAQIVAREQLVTARRLLIFAILTVSCVVTYSLALLLTDPRFV